MRQVCPFCFLQLAFLSVGTCISQTDPQSPIPIPIPSIKFFLEMQILLMAIYLLFCVLVAWVGRRTTFGFFAMLLASIFLTPLFTAILILLFRTRPPRPAKAPPK